MAEPVANGCIGLCCAAFHIPHTLTDLRTLAAGGHEEAGQIADMVIPLTPKEARERNHAFGGDGRFPWSKRGRHFTCRHWDEETRLCGNYEDRPSMCRGYPYEKEGGCDFGCTCKGSKVRDG